MKTTEQKIADLEEKFNKELAELKNELKPKEITLEEIKSKYDRDMEYRTTSFMIGLKNTHMTKFVAILDMIKVADYLNGDWKPDWGSWGERKYILTTNAMSKIISSVTLSPISPCYFKSEELAQKAITILGEERIKLALS